MHRLHAEQQGFTGRYSTKEQRRALHRDYCNPKPAEKVFCGICGCQCGSHLQSVIDHYFVKRIGGQIIYYWRRRRICWKCNAKFLEMIRRLGHTIVPTSLDLGCCSSITDEALVAVGSGSPQLKSLDLSSCGRITDAAVVALASGCKKLTTLDLSGCDITDAAVVALASGFPQLSSLNLCFCVQITDAAVVALASACQKLVSLDLDFDDNITEAAYATIQNILKARRA